MVPSTEPRVPLKRGPLLQMCPCQDWPQSGGLPDSTPAPTRKAGQSGSAWSSAAPGASGAPVVLELAVSVDW